MIHLIPFLKSYEHLICENSRKGYEIKLFICHRLAVARVSRTATLSLSAVCELPGCYMCTTTLFKSVDIIMNLDRNEHTGVSKVTVIAII